MYALNYIQEKIDIYTFFSIFYQRNITVPDPRIVAVVYINAPLCIANFLHTIGHQSVTGALLGIYLDIDGILTRLILGYGIRTADLGPAVHLGVPDVNLIAGPHRLWQSIAVGGTLLRMYLSIVFMEEYPEL